MTRTAIGTVCNAEQAEELNRERARQKQTRLVTTGTLVGIKDPTAEEVRDFLAEGGEVHDGCAMLTRIRAKHLAWMHTVYCARFCPVCVLRAEGYQL